MRRRCPLGQLADKASAYRDNAQDPITYKVAALLISRSWFPNSSRNAVKFGLPPPALSEVLSTSPTGRPFIPWLTDGTGGTVTSL